MIVRFGRRDDTFFTAWFWLARRIGTACDWRPSRMAGERHGMTENIGQCHCSTSPTPNYQCLVLRQPMYAAFIVTLQRLVIVTVVIYFVNENGTAVCRIRLNMPALRPQVLWKRLRYTNINTDCLVEVIGEMCT